MTAYQRYKNALKDCRYPVAFLDMNFFDENIDSISQRAGDKKIRIATKSVRSVEVLKYLKEKLGEKFNGYMCYSAEEALWLSSKGLDNLLVAYPSTDIESLSKISLMKERNIILMIDSFEHVEFLENLSGEFDVCIDVDLSFYLPGLNFGVFRSPLRKVQNVKELTKKIIHSKNLNLVGLMGYEAQVAGVTDSESGRGLMNFIIKVLKRISITKIEQLRKELVQAVKDAGGNLSFVNGGGTGSLESTREEDVVTEIAVGSGFYSPTLFDSYENFQHQPAMAYGLSVVRRPGEGIFTCFSGGYVASGGLGKDKIPTPYLPLGCKLNSNEMAGEVQTPVFYRGDEKLDIGSPIFFRHSKAGELCERFQDIKLIRDGKLEESIKTYRGEGQCFG